jgi:hypothetical protein
MTVGERPAAAENPRWDIPGSPQRLDMNKFVKIGSDMINLNGVSHITFVENQSGISDRIIIQVGEAVVTVDSAIGGKKRMLGIREKLMATLTPELWDESLTPEQAAQQGELPALAA